MDKAFVNQLRAQIEKTIQALEAKQDSSAEPIIDQYIERYRDARQLIDSTSAESITINAFRKLRNCARGYLETSSVWNQDFLREMSSTEKLLKPN
jgi:hypothetical protein